MLRTLNASIDTPLGGLRSTRRSLTTELVAALEQQILEQQLKAGDRLPTEAEIVQRFNVSRTVVREALSKLQAAGLVETRHGIGTFVLGARPSGIFRLDPADVAVSLDVLAVLELRVSLETESAGLAALRRSEEQLLTMRRALEDFEGNVSDAEETVSPDFRFHLEIARATGNRYFAEIMTHLGTTIIPRTRITSTQIPQDQFSEYLHRVNREHEQILDAITRQDPESARAAMRIHLINSRERLRRAQDVI